MVSLSSNQAANSNVHWQNKSNCGEKMLSEQLWELSIVMLLLFSSFPKKQFSVKLLGLFYTMNNTAYQKEIKLLECI